MQKADSITIGRSASYHVAAIFDSFCRIEAAEAGAQKVLGGESFHDRLEAGYNGWLAATLFFSAQVQQVVDATIDFERWNIGVFSYEHLEFQESAGIYRCESLPAYLWAKMSISQWYDMTCHQIPASAEWLEQSVRMWAEEQKLPIMDSSDEGLSAEELMAKYTTGDSWGDHPKFSRGCWQEEVSAGDVQSGYWDWVVSRVEQGDEGAA